MLFKDRQQAGELLAEQLKKLNLDKSETIVLAIPRGGVVIGAIVAKKLGAPLDIIVTRKLGAPLNPELAIGAITSEGGMVLDNHLIDELGVSEEYFAKESARELTEAKRREKVFRGEKPKINLMGKTVILVDDGLATGSTMEAAIHSVREKLPSRVILAVPVAPPDTIERLRNEAETVVIATPAPFYAIGNFYDFFPQVSDQEVVELLNG